MSSSRPNLWRRMTSTGGASLSELAAKVDEHEQEEPKTPCRTPKTPCRTPKTPIRVVSPRPSRSPPRRPAKVQIVVESTSTGSTGPVLKGQAAPLEDENLERPSLTRADLLGARPGHFDRTNASKAKKNETRKYTIIIPDDGIEEEVSRASFRTSIGSYRSSFDEPATARNSFRNSAGRRSQTNRGSFTSSPPQNAIVAK